MIPHPRERLDAVELAPFKAGIGAGAAGVMVAHIEMPALDGTAGPRRSAEPVVTGLLRRELEFDGLIYSDAMKMDAITKMGTPGENAVNARAGRHRRDPRLARSAGRVSRPEGGRRERPHPARRDSKRRCGASSKRRRGSACTGRARSISTRCRPSSATRKHAAVARQVSERVDHADQGRAEQRAAQLPPTSSVLYLSVLDYPRGWRIAAPSRAFMPALARALARRAGHRGLGSHHAQRARAGARDGARFDAIVAGVFVRASSGSGRLDLAPPVARCCRISARDSARRNQPFVAAFFGNPYTPMFVPEMPAMLLTYDFSDYAEESAVRAIAGEIAIGGRLPIALPGLFPVGHGLTRPVGIASPQR